MKKEGMPKSVIGHERFEAKRIERLSEAEKLDEPTWEQRETDHKLDALARDLMKNSGIVELAKEQAVALAEQYGSIPATPKEEFEKFEEDYGYNPVLVKKVFALFVSQEKHKQVA